LLKLVKAKTGFHVVATIAAKDVQQSLRSFGKRSPAIAATTIADILNLVPRVLSLPPYFLEGGRERTLGTRL